MEEKSCGCILRASSDALFPHQLKRAWPSGQRNARAGQSTLHLLVAEPFSGGGGGSRLFLQAAVGADIESLGQKVKDCGFLRVSVSLSFFVVMTF